VSGGDLVPVADAGPFDRVAREQHRHLLDAELAAAVRLLHAHAGWVERAGDRTTGRQLRFVGASALRDLGRDVEALEVVTALADDLDPAVEPLWRARALALSARCCLGLGRSGPAVEHLAEAAELLEHHPSHGRDHAAAAVAVGLAMEAAGAYDTALETLERVVRASTAHDLRVLPAVALLHLAWAAAHELAGAPSAAARHHGAAASTALRWRRAALERGALGDAVRSRLVEALALSGLGLPDAARAAVAGADLEAWLPPRGLERDLVQLYRGRERAQAGDLETARAHLEGARAGAARGGRPVWAATAEVALAEVEVADLGDHPALERWRGLVRTLVARELGQSRSFAADLWARRRVHQLTGESDRMSAAALQDPLTGLANRRALDAALSAAVREGRSVGACFVDVDSFKAVNDRWSHGVGDAVLRQVASIVAAACRSDDLVARYGGDEFVILTAGDAAVAEPVAERIRTAVAGHAWGELAEGLAVTVSVGMAPSLPAAAVLAAADAALLAAKRAGRDRVVTAVGGV